MEAETWEMDVLFTPKSSADGGWIMVEPYEGLALPCLEGGFLGLELAEGASAEDIRAVCAFLNARVLRLTYTAQRRPEWIDQPGRAALAKRRAGRWA
ncbi:MAG: hypothetical protein KIT81_06955 [Alphaproteobacteria bacterium]|nr:hypothetical protein [Alphaproteobacteria bacterium]